MTKQLDIAEKQLDRVLSFFSRVEAKASFIFAVNAGLLASIALNARFEDRERWFIYVPAFGCVALLTVSMWFVYRCTFPNLTGGSRSLVYFREIANRTEAGYIDEFLKQDEAGYARDLLGQVWRNSEILKLKCDDLKKSFTLAALALVPWFWFMIAATVVHSQTPVIK